jgi:hypothetical protein
MLEYAYTILRRFVPIVALTGLLCFTDTAMSTVNATKPPVLNTIGTAPALVHANSNGSVTDDWRGHSFITSIKNSSGQVIDTLPTPFAGFLIPTAGSYTVDVTIDGTSLPPVAITIKPSDRASIYIDANNGNDSNSGSTPTTPFKTLSHAITNHKVASKTSIFFAYGGTYTIAGGLFNFSGLTDITVDAYGNSLLGVPVIHVESANAFSFWGSSSNITISNVKVDSPFTIVTKAVGTQSIPYHQPLGNFGIIRGTNISLNNVQLGNLAEGVVIEPTGNVNATNIFINNLTQTDPLGILARNIMIEGATNLTVTNSTALNSINESPYRATGTGIVNGYFGNCKATVDPTSGSGKAAFTFRQAVNLHCYGCTAVDNEFSINWDISSSQSITNSLFDTLLINGSCLDIRPGSRGNIYRNITVNNAGSNLPCISVSAETNATNTIENAVVTGDIAGVKFWAATGLTVSNLTFHPTKATATLFAGDTSKLVNAGGNVMTGISGSISGSVTGEALTGTVTSAGVPLPGVTLYLDPSNTGKYADGMAAATTDASGNYSFAGLSAGATIVRQIIPAGYTQVMPGNDYGCHVSLSGNPVSSVNGQNFVDRKTA